MDAGLKIGPSTLLVRIFFVQSGDSFIREFFYQSEFEPISKRQFVTSEVIRILNIRHVISR
jgi:hypothetical protein